MDSKRLETLKLTAEKSLADKGEDSTQYSALLHDVSVYKAELEAQFHELLDTERRLDESNRELSNVIELAPFGILVIDEQLRVIHINEQAKNLLQINENSSVSNHIVTLFNKVELHKIITKWLLSESQDSLKLPIFDGWLKFENKKLNSSKVIVSIVDVSDEEEAKQVILNDKKNAIQSLKKQKYFVTSLGHELKNPLNIILDTFTYLSDGLSGESQEKLKKGQKSASSLLSAINQLLEFARLEAQMTQDTIQYTDLAEFVNIQVNKIKEKSENNNNFTITNKLFHNSYELNQLVFAGILTNLISNADKYTENGNIDITIETSVYPNTLDHKLLITVKDNGCGLDAEELNHIFNEYYRSEKNIKKQINGTGLGLSITKKLVSLLDGKISVESTENKGTSFYISLNASPVESLNPESDAQYLNNEAPNLNGDLIYIVDDNPLNLESLYRILCQTGAEIKKFSKAEDLLKAFRSTQPMLIITDIQMPEIDGVKLLELLQSHEFEGLVIAITAYNQPDEIEYYKTKGFSEILAKPLDSKRLFSLLSAYKH